MKALFLSLVLLALWVRPAEAQFFDPDTCLTCPDSREHFAGGAILGFGIQALPSSWRSGWADAPWKRGLTVTILGAVYEAGQWDAHRHDGLNGKPGFGFGVKDLAVDVAGWAFSELVTAGLRKVF